jgi:YVTN family beta-propeller protein
MKAQVLKFLVFISIMVFVLSAANMVHAVTQLSVPSTIGVGSSPEYAAYDSGKGEIFVTNQEDGSVSVISDSSNSVTHTITGVGQYPTGIAYDSKMGEIFVTDEGDGTNNGSVAVISDGSYSVIQTITVGVGPEGIAYDSGKGEMFVANTNYNAASSEGSAAPASTVSVISDSTNNVVGTITVGVGPIGVAYDQGKNEIFVSNELSSTVSVISDSNNQVVATVNAGSGPEGLAYDSAKGEIYVADEVSGGFQVISDSNHKVVATNTMASATYWGNPTDLTYDSNKAEIFEETGTYIVVISDKNNDVTAYAPLVQLPISVDSYGPLAEGVAYDSVKGEIFVVNSGDNDVSVLSDSSTSTSTSPSASASAPSSTQTTLSSAPSSGSDNLIFIIIGVIAIVVVVAIVGFKFTRRKAESKGPVAIPAGSASVDRSGASKNDDGGSGSGDESKASSTAPNVTAQESNSQAQTTRSTQQVQQRPLNQQERAERFRRLVSTFQQKGANSPEKAMTAEQLGLPPRFEEFIKERNEGQTQVFKELNGKYYLDQKALKEVREQWAKQKKP